MNSQGFLFKNAQSDILLGQHTAHFSPALPIFINKSVPPRPRGPPVQQFTFPLSASLLPTSSSLLVQHFLLVTGGMSVTVGMFAAARLSVQQYYAKSIVLHHRHYTLYSILYTLYSIL